MSAVLKDVPYLAAMREADLDEVIRIENAIYTHPWTRGNFNDSLQASYLCRAWQRSGHGSALLREAAALARQHGAEKLLLEVRPPNHAAQSLYRRFGFRRIGVRRGYYPAHSGREDALVLALPLK